MPKNSTYSRASMALPAWGLRATGKFTVPIYKLTRGRLLGSIGTGPVLLLTTIGRRSGEPRTAPVVYLSVEDEKLVVIGSNAGNTAPPGWALNLRANPEADIQVRGDRRRVRARVAEGKERAELWRRSNEQFEGFDKYEERTDREISVFVLEPR